MTNTMKALIKEADGTLGVRRVAHASSDDATAGPHTASDVLVRIAYAGICRTDLYAAEGRLPIARDRKSVVLGHEASGIIEHVGADARSRMAPGDHVTVIPLVRCGSCACCVQGQGPLECASPLRVGLDRDGVFAEWVSLPASSVRVVPAEMSLRLAAYVEPAAAALAVLDVLPRMSDRILVYGKGRVGLLTERVFRAHGHANVQSASAEEALQLEPSSFDIVVETIATNETLGAAIRAVRRGGRIVLKSRPFEPVAFDIRLAVEKEVTLQAVRYAQFGVAIENLASGHLPVDDLLGDAFPLERYEEAFDAARRESTKPFFRFGEG